jgi:hypothetical protein
MLLPAGVMDELVLQFQLIQSSAPDDGQKHRPKHVELTTNNKLAYIVASRCLYS